MITMKTTIETQIANLTPTDYNMSLGVTGKFRLTSLMNITNAMSSLDISEENEAVFESFELKGYVENISGASIIGTFGIIVIQYPTGGAIPSEAEYTTTQDNLDDYLDAILDQDMRYKVLLVSAKVLHMVYNSNTPAFYMTTPLSVEYRKPKMSRDDQVKFGYRSDAVAVKEYETGLYAFFMQGVGSASAVTSTIRGTYRLRYRRINLQELQQKF